ncbi:PWI domain-containing protein [Coemansia spiralis]|nr:PWI domain-containing protein [Coemansia spiralis]
MSGGFFKGANIEQDIRFGDASKKLLQQMNFSSALKKPVDMTKVNMEAIKPWLARKISELLGLEDEVLYEYVVNMLEESQKPDPKLMQVNLTGFFESKTQEFMQSLWKVLLEAQKSPGGIPESFIQNKIEELKRKREEEELIRANIKIADERAKQLAPSNNSIRITKSGRKSRWDAPSTSTNAASLSVGSKANDVDEDSKTYSREHRHNGDTRQSGYSKHDRHSHRSHRSHPSSRSKSPSALRSSKGSEYHCKD